MKAKPMSYKKVTEYIIQFVHEYDLYDEAEMNALMGELVDYIGKRQRPDLHPKLIEPEQGRSGVVEIKEEEEE